MESFGAYTLVDPRPASDDRDQKILEGTTYYGGCRYQVGMLWPNGKTSLPNNNFSALVQLKNPDRCFDKNTEIKDSYAQTILSDLDKRHIVKKDEKNCS